MIKVDKMVSVVIPVADRELELRRAIASVLSQTHSNLEVIVVENNSRHPDLIESTVHQLADSRIHVYHVSPCDNANVARSFGVGRSRGEFVAFLDSDDQWRPEHIENCLNVLNLCHADFVYGGVLIDDGQSIRAASGRDLRPGESGLDYVVGRDNSWASTITFCMDRSVFELVDWDPILKRHQDYDLFCQIVEQFKVAYNLSHDVVINWRDGEVRVFDGDSIVTFYTKWCRKMSFITECFFVQRRVRLLLRRGQTAVAIRLLWLFLGSITRRIFGL